MAYFINDKCVGCSACETVCPVTAISGVKKEFYFIDPKVCIDCGACGRACPYDAIFDTYGNTAEKVRRTEWAPPGLPADLDLARAREVAVEAARASGEILRSRVDSIREIRHKSAVDIVTDVDVQSEHEVSARLLKAFPTHSILGEEGGARMGSEARYRWIVDPLDGTTNYAHGFPFFCVSIGLEVDGRMVLGVAYAPSLDELFVAEAGRGATVNDRPMRVSTTAELPLALLATGFPYDRAE